MLGWAELLQGSLLWKGEPVGAALPMAATPAGRSFVLPLVWSAWSHSPQLWQPPAHSLLYTAVPRVQCSLALLSQELKISVLQAQTIEKQCLRKSSQKIHSKDKVKHPAYCSVFSYQHVPPPSTIRVNIYRAAFSTSQLQFTDTNLHT